MSLRTFVPVGSKSRCVALCPSPNSNQFLLSTGSWDQDRNSIGTFSLDLDATVMEEAASLATSRFRVSSLGSCSSIDGDVTVMKYISEGQLVFGTSSGRVGLLEGITIKTVIEHSGAGCVSVDVLDDGQWLVVFADGNIEYGRVGAFKRIALPKTTVPLAAKLVNPSHCIISTSTSKVILLDLQSGSIKETIRVSDKLVNVRAIDSSDWLLCTGDDDGIVRLFDMRAPSAPIAVSVEARKTITAVKIHQSLPNQFISASIDGSIIRHELDGSGSLVETWRMAPAPTVAVNSLDMLGSLMAAGLDNASALVWRML